MKIVFNALKCNLGNTGGCLSIVESAEILRKLGHDVDIVTTRNRMTWKKVNHIKKIPECDVCIAISTADIDKTRKANAKRKVLWLRGPEWRFGVQWFPDKFSLKKKLRTFIQAGGEVLCNSKWLADKLVKWGFEAGVQYVGLDFDFWKDLNVRKPDGPINVGTLKTDRSSKKYKKFLRIMEGLKEHGDYRPVLLQKANPEMARATYSKCHIWVSPSVLEGFHRVPAEAALCGCLVIAIDKRRGGTDDWLTHLHSGLRYKSIAEAVELITSYSRSMIAKDIMIKNAQDDLRHKVGSKEDNMKKLVERFR